MRLALAELRLGALERGDLRTERLVALGGAALLVEALLDRDQVGEHELVLERPQVARRVVAVGGPHDEHQRVAVAQRAEQTAAEALPGLGRQPGQEGDLEGRGHDLLRLRHLGQRVEPLVGDVHDPEQALRRVLGVDAGQRREQLRVPGVGETNDPQVLHDRSG